MIEIVGAISENCYAFYIFLPQNSVCIVGNSLATQEI